MRVLLPVAFVALALALAPAVSGQGVPSAPLNLAAVAGDQQVTLTWDPPSSDGGLAITNYRIYRGTGAGAGFNEWRNTNPSVAPSPRYAHAMAYDSQSDRTIMFGGTVDVQDRVDETWDYDWNTNLWANMNPLTRPSKRAVSAMAYDSQSDRIVLFGGSDNGAITVPAETWSYDFDTNTWTNMAPASQPGLRRGSAMAYDSLHDRIIMFGGWGGSGGVPPDAVIADTWAYDIDTNTWTNMAPAAAPPARELHGMVYDFRSDRVILFGGFGAGGAPLGDTWAYSFTTNTWTNMNPAVAPSPRGLHAMAFDGANGKIVLFGGDTGALNGETWVYDVASNTWTNMTPGTAPSARWGHQVAYDSANGKVVMFGGNTVSRNGETWVYPAATPIATLGNVLTFTDTGLTNGVTYYYRVAARNAVGLGPTSNEVSAAPASDTMTITTSTTLTADVTGHIVIAADGITLDCAGRTVTGSSLDIGIDLTGRTGVTVTNCRVINARWGFLLASSSGNTLTGNAATGNGFTGFLLVDSSGNLLEMNAADGNGDGFVLSLSNSNVLEMNTADDNAVEGFELLASSSNTLTGNTADGNINGFRLADSSSGNTLTGNTASGNFQGFLLDSSSGNTLTGNAATGNGYALFGSSSNSLSGNTASGNGFSGFFLSGSTSNDLTGNTADGMDFGFILVSADSNTLTGNTASGNGNGFRVDFSNSNILTGNTAVGSFTNGFALFTSSSFNDLTENAATGNGGDGFRLGFSNFNFLSANTADGNGNGYALFGSSVNTLSGNTASGNVFDGFLLVDSSSNVLEMNTADGNAARGFALFGSPANTLTGNVATRNGIGYELSGSSTNTLTGNAATRNGIGYELSGSSANTLTGNAATRNGIGYELSGSSANTLTGNVATRNTDGFLVISDSVGNVITRNIIVSNVHGIHICESLVPLNTITPNSFIRNQIRVFVDESC